MRDVARVVIAAAHSGAGKTTIVTGLLSALRARGLAAQAYKIGPDYIDPGYHALASGRPAHNLDSWLMEEDALRALFMETASDSDIAVIEGVMGLYDGGRKGISSTARIAKLLDAPVVLVVDARSMGESAAAVVLGFKQYDPAVRLAGVIVNRIGSAAHRKMVVEAVERLGVPVLGCVGRDEKLAMPQRHLGLTPATERDAADDVAYLRSAIARQVDCDRILAAARAAAPMAEAARPKIAAAAPARIGVARDEAFSFYYPDSLQVLARYGAELVPFSPLRDRALPAVDGLIFGGGFPEMFAGQLSENGGMREAVRSAGRRGTPIYAECGGLMYLTRGIVDFSGRRHAMVGLIPAACRMNERLQTVGYVEARAFRDTVLCRAGDALRGHEFHFSSMEEEEGAAFPWAFEFTKTRTGAVYPSGYAAGNILASYLHLHFAGNEAAARRFLQQCAAWRQGGPR